MRTLFWALLTILLSPVLWIISLIRHPVAPKRVLIIQLGKLGDVLCTTGMFRAVKAADPSIELHVLCWGRFREVLSGNPSVDHVHAYDGSRTALFWTLFHLRFSAVINCLPGALPSAVGLWSAAPVRVSTSSSGHGILVSLFRIFNNVNVPFITGTSTHAHYMKLLAPLGIPAILRKLEYFPSVNDQDAAMSWLKDHALSSKSFVCFNISAGNTVKEWPAASFAALADQVIEKHQLSVVLSTLDHQKVKAVMELSHHAEKMMDASSLTLGQCAAMMKNAAAFVAVDTGPLFLADAMGTPIAVIVGGSHPNEQIPPVSDRVRHVLPPAGSQPWMFVSKSPRVATAEQLKSITGTSVEAVERALGDMLIKN